MVPNGNSDDLLDEAARMIGMAFGRMEDEGLTNQEIVLRAYDITSAIRMFVAEAYKEGVSNK